MGSQASGGVGEVALHSSHPRLQGARVAAGSGQALMRVTVALAVRDYNVWAERLLTFKKSTSKLLLPVRHTFTPGGACGQLGSVDAYYPAFPYLLSDEIHDRRGKRRPFSEQELWFLLFSLAKAHHQNAPVLGPLQALSPANVFLNEEGSVKVPTALSWPQPASAPTAEDDPPGFLSPEEVEATALAEEVAQLEAAGCMFAMGLTVLSAGNLADYLPLYGEGRAALDLEALGVAVRQWSSSRRYSQALQGAVVSLCAREPELRLTADELWGLLGQHEESIAKKQNFVIDNAPARLHQGVQQARALREPTPPIQPPSRGQ